MMHGRPWDLMLIHWFRIPYFLIDRMITMKRQIVFIFFLVGLILTSCNSNNRSEDKDQFRRYCFALKGELEENLDFPEDLRMNVFRNDSMIFIIIDAGAGMDLAALKQNIDKSFTSDDENMPALLRKIVSGEIIPLERIYELEQEKVYSPEEGQLKESPGMEYQRTVMSMELHPYPASIKKYIEIHGIGQAWPEITAGIKETGNLDMEIYIQGTLTFLIADRDEAYKPEKGERHTTGLSWDKEWQEYVSQFQKTDPATGEKWVPMDKIY